jgi:hypothetical protein
VSVAAGGGGDVIAAWAVHASRSTDRPVIATFAWDRLIIDPLPGPRAAGDFDQLSRVDDLNYAITRATQPRPPAGSTLPRIAAELDALIVLLDPTDGAVGLRNQLRALVATSNANSVEVIDVGGDVLARGDEPTLLSPLADSLALAAARDLDAPVTVRVIGPGLDGELPTDLVLAYLRALGGTRSDPLDPVTADRALGALRWHPSEATALAVAAVLGIRGVAEIRDRGSLVSLDDTSAAAWVLDADRAVAHNLAAAQLTGTKSLLEAEEVVRDVCGRSEIDYERAKARTLATTPVPDPACQLAAALAYLDAAHARGVGLLTIRRLAEIAGARGDDLDRFRAALADALPHQYRPPVLLTEPPS